MATGRSIRAGKAVVELGVRDRINEGLKAAKRKFKSFAVGIARVGAVTATAGVAVAAGAAAGIGLSVRKFIQAGDALDKMSARTGTSVEFLSKLGHAAQIGGTDIGAMEVGIRRLQRTALDADRGLSTATEAFGRLGIGVHDAQGKLKPTEQLFTEVAGALAKVGNNTEKAALATMIFGRSGTSLLPMLQGGAKGLQAMMEEAEKLGIVMSTQDAKAAARLNDQFTRLGSVVKMAVIHVGSAFAPVLEALMPKIIGVGKAVGAWVKRWRSLFAQTGAIREAFSLLRRALAPIGRWFVKAAADVGAFVNKWRFMLDSLEGAGDVGRLIWAKLRIAFAQGKTDLLAVWYELRRKLLEVMVNVAFNVKAIWVKLVAELKAMWKQLMPGGRVIRAFSALMGGGSLRERYKRFKSTLTALPTDEEQAAQARTASKLQKLEAERLGIVMQIADANQRALATAQAGGRARIAQLKAEQRGIESRIRLHRMLSAAAGMVASGLTGAAGAMAGTPAGPAGGRGELAGAFAAMFAPAAAMMEQAKRPSAVAVAGAGRGLSGLGAYTIERTAERTANAAEETAANTRQMAIGLDKMLRFA